MAWVSTETVVVKGHGVASAPCLDPRFPHGTLVLQTPRFKECGLDLGPYFLGTLNLSIHPCGYVIRKSRHTFVGLKWHPDIPPEDFSFFDCRVCAPGAERRDGLIYMPHPETKPQHHQPPDVLEVVTTYIEDLQMGASVVLDTDPEQLVIE